MSRASLSALYIKQKQLRTTKKGIGLTENEFKKRFNLHKSSFKLEHKRTLTTFNDHFWKLKKQKHRLQHQMGDLQKGEAILNR